MRDAFDSAFFDLHFHRIEDGTGSSERKFEAAFQAAMFRKKTT